MNNNLVETLIHTLDESENEYDKLSEINLEDITDMNTLLSMEYEVPIVDMVKCPECKSIFNKNDNTIETTEQYEEPVYDGFDMYHIERHTTDIEKIVCPYCKHEDDIDEFYEATTEDLIYAPNNEELLPGITSAIDKYEEEDK